MNFSLGNLPVPPSLEAGNLLYSFKSSSQGHYHAPDDCCLAFSISCLPVSFPPCPWTPLHYACLLWGPILNPLKLHDWTCFACGHSFQVPSTNNQAINTTVSAVSQHCPSPSGAGLIHNSASPRQQPNCSLYLWKISAQTKLGVGSILQKETKSLC